MVYCPYCGNEIESSSKFCIYCGKPRVVSSNPSKRESSVKAPPPPAKQVPEKVDESAGEQSEPSPVSTKEGKEKGDAVAPAKKKEEEERDFAKDLVVELPPEIKEQLEARMELAILKTKKKKVIEKVTEVTKKLDEPEFELDLKYRDEVKTKIKALKEIKTEIDQQETTLNAKINRSFRLVSLPTRIKVLKDQIDELKTNFKFKKVEKSVFEQLNTEYTDELKKNIKEQADLLIGLKTWLTNLKADKLDLDREVKLAKARFKSKEISKERLESLSAEVDGKVNKVEEKIKVLQQFLEK